MSGGALRRSSFFVRAPPPRTRRFSAGAARPVLAIRASPAPNPGSLFPRRKSDQNAAGDTPDPAFVQSVGIRFAAALPLNQCLLASDLRRAAYPASAVALLKGEANLGFYDTLPAPIGDAPAPISEQETTLIPRAVNYRTDYEGPAALWKFSGCPVSNLMVTDWANNGGLGSPQRFFRPLLGVQKWARRRQSGVWGRSPRR